MTNMGSRPREVYAPPYQMHSDQIRVILDAPGTNSIQFSLGMNDYFHNSNTDTQSCYNIAHIDVVIAQHQMFRVSNVFRSHKISLHTQAYSSSITDSCPFTFFVFFILVFLLYFSILSENDMGVESVTINTPMS